MQRKNFVVPYLVATLILVLAHNPMTLAAQPPTPPAVTKVDIKDGKVSAYLVESDIDDVLTQIVRGTGVTITVGPTLKGKKVSHAFDDKEPADAIKEVLNMGKSFYRLTYAVDPREPGQKTLKEVRAEGDIVGTISSNRRMSQIDIPYGSGKGEVGAVVGTEGSSKGPESFNIDTTGTIYICDILNHRIQAYKQDGTFMYTVPLGGDIYPIDIVIDESGLLYILDGRGLHQFDNKGKRLKTITPDVSHWKAILEMHLINNGIYMWACDDTTCSDYLIGTIVDRNLNPPSLTESKGLKDKGRYTTSGKVITRSRRQWDHRVTLFIQDNSATYVTDLSIPINDMVSLTFLNEDDEGNLYIKTVTSENKALLTDVHTFNQRGEYVSTTRLPEKDIFFWSQKITAVGRDGVIYEFIPEKSKLRLNIFTK